MGEINYSNTWQCPSCGEMNSVQNHFCKKCGFTLAEENSSQKTKMLWKILIGIVALIVVVGGAVAGYLYWKKVVEEKQAKVYIQEQQKIFSDSVRAINEISSETNMEKKYRDEENLDLVVEKFNTEKIKTDALVGSFVALRQASEKIIPNAHVSGVDFLVKNFFMDGDKMVSKYGQYMNFNYANARANVNVDKEQERFANKFKSAPSSVEEYIGFAKALKDLIDETIKQYDMIDVPDGLKEYKKPVEDMKILSQKIGEFIKALEDRDIKKIMALDEEISDASNAVAKSFDRANGILDDYYSQMHDEFSSLRSRADKIKSEFTIAGSLMKVAPIDYSIDSW